MLDYQIFNSTTGSLSLETAMTSTSSGPTSLETAMTAYGKIHGPLALVVCVIGIIMNIINIVVLSHKEMVSSVNRLLQAIGELGMRSVDVQDIGFTSWSREWY